MVLCKQIKRIEKLLVEAKKEKEEEERKSRRYLMEGRSGIDEIENEMKGEERAHEE